MNTTPTFSLRRLGLFIKSDLVINAATILTFGITAFAVLFLYGLISANEMRTDSFRVITFAWIFWVFFGGGLWLTSKAFVDLHNEDRQQNFLLLPASNLEKFLGRLLLTTVGYVIGVGLIFYLASLLVAACTWLIYGEPAVIFNLPHLTVWHNMLDYILLQSLFFLGAIYFKSSNFSKTILCLCGLILIFFCTAFIVFVLFLGLHLLYGWQALILYSTALRLIFTLMLLPCTWLIAYLRLCESEV